VLNYKTPADTAIAVASLMASDRPVDEVIVVDNDEGPECQDALARWAGRVTYLRSGTNLGFAGGMNVGIRRALGGGAARILLVNSDMVVPPDCLGRLDAALDAGASPSTPLGAGIAGPLVMSRSVPDLIGSAGIDYNIVTGRMRHRMQRHSDADVDAVSGCLMLIRREVFDRIGLLDERYFFSFEEIDFCLRARAAGFPTRLAGNAVAYHEGGQAMGPHSPRRLYFAARNHLMLARNHANGDGPLTRGGRSFFIAALNLAHAVKAPGSSLGARLGATLRGICDYFVN
jgi:GT2 family glycosyltransferase